MRLTECEAGVGVSGEGWSVGVDDVNLVGATTYYRNREPGRLNNTLVV
jgi:hypothetical protein